MRENTIAVLRTYAHLSNLVNIVSYLLYIPQHTYPQFHNTCFKRKKYLCMCITRVSYYRINKKTCNLQIISTRIVQKFINYNMNKDNARKTKFYKPNDVDVED